MRSHLYAQCRHAQDMHIDMLVCECLQGRCHSDLVCCMQQCWLLNNRVCASAAIACVLKARTSAICLTPTSVSPMHLSMCRVSRQEALFARSVMPASVMCTHLRCQHNHVDFGSSSHMHVHANYCKGHGTCPHNLVSVATNLLMQASW
jgi:hypothetical protein